MNYIHGMRYTRIYKIYHGIRARCDNNIGNKKSFALYGARGITYEWKTFEDFYKDMSESYNNHVKKFGERNTTIDRINGEGNYSKENCRWATHKEQNNNSRQNHYITYKGETKTLANWADELGIKRTTLYMRINQYKYPIERALNPKRRGGVYH